MSITIKNIGKDKLGRAIDSITLKNANGASATVMNFGATLLSVCVPDKDNNFSNVCLRYNNLSDYDRPKNGYPGATVGRFANRIANGRFMLNGKEYNITKNEGNNTLHGGALGFDRQWWAYECSEGKDANAVHLHYTSHDGEEGFPGNLRVQVVYLFTENNELQINYMATCDEDTVINLTNHSYFNLANSGDCLNHEVQIISDAIVETGDGLIPTGELLPVKNTPYDLNNFTRLSEAISKKDSHPMMARDNGFDVSYDLNTSEYHHAVTLRCPDTRRIMKVYTDQPAVQFYSGQGLKGGSLGDEGKEFVPFGGLAFETQHHPDSVNRSNFPSTVLRKGEVFTSTTSYAFSVF